MINKIKKNSEDIDTRRIGIQAFKVLELKSNDVFKILENCILSEDDPLVRRTAIEVIQQLFPKKSKSMVF